VILYVTVFQKDLFLEVVGSVSGTICTDICVAQCDSSQDLMFAILQSYDAEAIAARNAEETREGIISISQVYVSIHNIKINQCSTLALSATQGLCVLM